MQYALVDGSQLLLSLSLQLMLLNGPSPPAVNWLGMFPAGYRDDDWHPHFPPRQMEVIWRDSSLLPLTFTFGAAAMATRPGRLSPQPLTIPSMQFTAQWSWSHQRLQRTYAPAEELRCQETISACACIFYISKSFGLYISQSLQLSVEIHQEKKNPTTAAAGMKRVTSFPPGK